MLECEAARGGPDGIYLLPVFFPYDQFEPGPHIVNRAHLHVHEAVGEGIFPDRVLCDVRFDTG